MAVPPAIATTVRLRPSNSIDAATLLLLQQIVEAGGFDGLGSAIAELCRVYAPLAAHHPRFSYAASTAFAAAALAPSAAPSDRAVVQQPVVQQSTSSIPPDLNI